MPALVVGEILPRISKKQQATSPPKKSGEYSSVIGSGLMIFNPPVVDFPELLEDELFRDKPQSGHVMQHRHIHRRS